MDAVQACRLAEENELLRKEVQRLLEECQTLQKTTREQETSISILTMTCEQLVDELDSVGPEHAQDPLHNNNHHRTDKSRSISTLSLSPSPPPPPSSSSSSGQPSSLPTSTSTHDPERCSHQISPPPPVSPCHRCQTLSEELSTTRQELKFADRQLKCAAKQKLLLQEKLCQYEEDIGILVQRQLLQKLE